MAMRGSPLTQCSSRPRNSSAAEDSRWESGNICVDGIATPRDFQFAIGRLYSAGAIVARKWRDEPFE